MKRFLLLSIPLLITLLTACPEPTPPTGTKPTITSFTASPSTLPAGGGTVTLSWEAKDATSLSVDNGVGTVTGISKAVTVTNTTTFTLTATNDEGSATQTTSVSVGSGADTTAPTVVSIDPPNGATGVEDDQSIVITFSEKMDQLSAQAAYQSADLPASEVTFNWNAEGTQLTVKANDFLEYAAGDDPSIEAKTYALTVTSTAKDVAGNSLTPFSSSFSTLRVISAAIYGTASLDGTESCVLTRETFLVGDLFDGPTDSGSRGFVSFDLTDIPAGAVAEEARVIINKVRINNNPYDLGDILLEHMNYGDSLDGNDYDMPVLADLGSLDSASAPATGYLSSEVTSAFNDDLANRTMRGNRSQYRLRFPIENNDNDASDYVVFTSSDGPEGQRPFINVVYYIP
jgi:Bacterial Ig-like domain